MKKNSTFLMTPFQSSGNLLLRLITPAGYTGHVINYVVFSYGLLTYN